MSELSEAVAAYARKSDGDWHGVFDDPAVHRALLEDTATSRRLRGWIMLALVDIAASPPKVRASRANGKTQAEEAEEVSKRFIAEIEAAHALYRRLVARRDDVETDFGRRHYLIAVLVNISSPFPKTNFELWTVLKPARQLLDLGALPANASQAAFKKEIVLMHEKYNEIDIAKSPFENLNVYVAKTEKRLAKDIKILKLADFEIHLKGTRPLPLLRRPANDTLPTDDAWGVPPLIRRDLFEKHTSTEWSQRNERLWVIPDGREITYLTDRQGQQWVDPVSFFDDSSPPEAAPSPMEVDKEEKYEGTPQAKRRKVEVALTQAERDALAVLPAELLKIVLDYALQQPLGQRPRAGPHAAISRTALALWRDTSQKTRRLRWNQRLSIDSIRRQLALVWRAYPEKKHDTTPSVFWIFLLDLVTCLGSRIRARHQSAIFKVAAKAVFGREDVSESFVDFAVSPRGSTDFFGFRQRCLTMLPGGLETILTMEKDSGNSSGEQQGFLVCLSALLMGLEFPLRIEETLVSRRPKFQTDGTIDMLGDAYYYYDADMSNPRASLIVGLTYNLLLYAKIKVPLSGRFDKRALFDALRKDHTAPDRQKSIESIEPEISGSLAEMELVVARHVAGLVQTIAHKIAKESGLGELVDPLFTRNETAETRRGRLERLASVIDFQRALLDSIDIHYTAGLGHNYISEFHPSFRKARNYFTSLQGITGVADMWSFSRQTPLESIVDPATGVLLHTPARYVIRRDPNQSQDYRAFFIIGVNKLQAVLGSLPKASFDVYQALHRACDELEQEIGKLE